MTTIYGQPIKPYDYSSDHMGGVTLHGPEGRTVYFQPGDDADHIDAEFCAIRDRMDAAGAWETAHEDAARELWATYGHCAE